MLLSSYHNNNINKTTLKGGIDISPGMDFLIWYLSNVSKVNNKIIRRMARYLWKKVFVGILNRVEKKDRIYAGSNPDAYDG